MYLFLISLIPFLILTYDKSKKSYHMLQQNFYKQTRYFKWINKNLNKVFIDVDLIYILLVVGVFLNKYLFMVIFFGLSILLIYLYRKKISLEQVKKKLVITSRIKRMFITEIIIYMIVILIICFNYNNEYIYLYYFCLIILTYLNYFVISLINLINKPIEKLVYLKYKNKALKTLKLLNIPVIGITGSYGKTSSKNIMRDILNVKLNVVASPKSFNTPNGLIRTINENLDKFSDLFIAEMGAFKRGEIKEICDLVHPKYGVITAIGEAHLESFGSRENIQKGKFELIESLPSDGTCVLNADDLYQVNYKIKNNCKIIWIGIDAKKCDIKARNIKISSNGSTFTVKLNDKDYLFKTKLLGKHNIYNILAGIAIGYELGLTPEELVRGVASIKQIEHRLELKKYGLINIIDDSYNSNPVGSSSALDVLNLMEGTKIIVTPGMIELGDEEYKLNYEFGCHIAHVCDYVILVGEKQTKPILQALNDEKFASKKIYIINDVKEAFQIMNKYASTSTYVLLENDLPDLFNEN